MFSLLSSCSSFRQVIVEVASSTQYCLTLIIDSDCAYCVTKNILRHSAGKLQIRGGPAIKDAVRSICLECSVFKWILNVKLR